MLHYQVIGQGKPIVLLHGYLENSTMWDDFIEPLSKTHQLILIDLPGHGKSKVYMDTHTMEFMACKVNEVLEHLKINSVTIIGHSMGGYVALAFAQNYSKKLNGFMLLNSSSLPDSDEKKELRLRAIQVAQKDLSSLINISVPSLFAEHHRATMKEAIQRAKAIASQTPVNGAVAALKGMPLRADTTEVLTNFSKPVAIVIGEFDQAINPKDLLAVIPNRKNITITLLKTGHMSHSECPQKTLEAINVFLAKV